MFKRTPLYIKIATNKVEITNLNTGETIVKAADKKFSTERIVIADFNVIELLIRTIVEELVKRTWGLPSQLKALVQQVEKAEGGITEIERRAMRDLAEQAGASIVVIIDHDRKLSDQQALLELENA